MPFLTGTCKRCKRKDIPKAFLRMNDGLCAYCVNERRQRIRGQEVDQRSDPDRSQPIPEGHIERRRRKRRGDGNGK